MRQRLRSSAVFVVVIAFAICGSVGRATSEPGVAAYGITDLGTIGGALSVATAISNDTAFPIVAGYGATASGAEHAFQGNAWGVRDMGTLGGARSYARAAANGSAVGDAQLASGRFHAVMFGARNIDLGTLGGSESSAAALNASFVVVGTSSTANDAATRAFRYENGVMSDVGATLGGNNTAATAINGAGHVAGWADVSGGGRHAFLYRDGFTLDLGSFDGNSEALALNDLDVVVGRVMLAGGSQHAFRYWGGSLMDLGSLGGASSEASSVNNAGGVVGWAENAQGARRAFLWRDGVMTDLNTMVGSGTGWVLEAATSIGNSGAISGYGQFQGQRRAFLLTPPNDLRVSLRVHSNNRDTNIPNPHEAGQPLTLGVTVNSSGPFTATGVTVEDVVSGPVEIIRWSSGVQSCVQAGLRLTCRLSPVDFTRDFFIDVRATGPGRITHSALVTADQPDPNTADNSASESNIAVSLATLSLNQASVVGGTSVSSRVTLTSPTPAGGATVKLTSSHPDVASVPAQVDVLPSCCDGMWREFNITTRPVSAPVTVGITASYGLVSRTVALTILPPAAGSPRGGTAWAIPGTIQAEDFDDGGEGVAYVDQDVSNNGGAYRATGVDIQGTSDGGAGFNVGWMYAGEWLNYQVNVAAAGTYTMEARVASPGTGGSFHVAIDGVDKTGAMVTPDTGGWQTWTTVTRPISLTAGAHTLRVAVDSNGTSGAFGNLNYLRFTSATASNGPTAFNGAPLAIPGIIEAEQFDNGGEGVGYHDGSTANNGGQYRAGDVDIEGSTDANGGYNVGWMNAGEWLNYTVSVASTGTYTLTARVAANGAGGTFHVEFGGVNKTGSITIPNTGGWQAWTDVSVTVALNAGVQSMRFVEDANGPTGVFGNLNYVRLAR